jgi:alpha-beta hydrolase superfamily lysophospholipase
VASSGQPIATSRPATEVDERRWWRRHLRAIAAAGLALLVILAIGTLVAWHFASFVLVPDHSPSSEQVEIEALSPGRIEFRRSDATERPGVYGLAWEAGHAVLGPVLHESADSVTRRLSDVHGFLVPGIDAGIDSDVYFGNPREAVGLPYRAVTIPAQLGPMPAWEIPAAANRHAGTGTSSAWAIVVHGINGDRQIGLRIAPTLHRVGFNSLLISYRDDLGAPSSPDGLHHQGQTEWRDLETAVRYALRRGARRLILDGYSMGGALIAQFMERSPLADRVDGLVLDAPALDWRAILEYNATRMSLPSFAALPVEWAIDARTDVDWNSLDALRHSEDFHLPILLFHGDDDAVIPLSTSEDFAAELPHWVTYYRVPKAGHTQSWNVDPKLYDGRLRRFLLQIGTKAERARPVGSGSNE